MRFICIFVVIAALAIGAVCFMITKSEDKPAASEKPGVSAAIEKADKAMSGEPSKNTEGVRNASFSQDEPKTEAVTKSITSNVVDKPTDEKPAKTATPEEESKETPSEPLSYGAIKPVAGDANPQVAMTLEALKTGKNPERVSLMAKLPPFDPAIYQRDPASYLSDHRPL